MAISAEQRNELISLLVGMFDAAPSADLLTQFVASIEGGQTVAELANDLAATDEFASLYPVWLTDSEFATNFVTNILDGNTDSDALQEGIDFVEALLNGGATRGEAVNTAVEALSGVDVSDATWGQAAQGLINKVDVATYFATTKLTAAADFDSLRAVVADVTADTDTVSEQMILIDAGLDSLAQNLTTGQDMLTGSAGNDAFTAWIFNNANTAQSGDYIDGGAGTDTLLAEIGNSQAFAISLKTNSVDVAQFRAQAASSDANGDNDVTDAGSESIDKEVQIDAQDMVGTTEFWSVDSRSNLTIEDIQAGSNSITLGWRNSDAGNVNYEVYFDNITAPGATTANSQLFLEVLDLEGMRTDGEPLLNNPYVGVQFTMDGTTVSVAADAPVQTTYADLVAGINAELAEQGISTVTASLGSTFSAINSDDGLSYEGTTIVLTNTGPEVLAGVGWIVDGILPPDSNVHTSIDDTPPTVSSELTQTNIVFDYVGSGSKSADFVAGEMSQSGGSIESGSAGIQQFNIDVDRTSWLDTLRSTNNTLEVVNLENIGAAGNIRIDDLNDVRIVDASAMTGNVTLDVDLSDDTIAKFLNRVDTAADGTSDNVTATYTMGSGNDSLNLAVSREVAAHEDFLVSVSGGNGNDSIVFEFVNDGGTLDVNWLADQKDLKNATVSSGAGDDTITTKGAGDVTISAGSGDDAVYTDNSGIDTEKATWVFNAANTDVNDIQGTALQTTILAGATVTVTFSGANAGGGITSGAAVANDEGFESSVVIGDITGDQRTINQAIKNAILNDEVLSDLLSVVDGPDNTLIVTSKIDGVSVAADLDVTVTPATAAYFTSNASALTAVSDLNRDESNNSTLANLSAAAAVTFATTGSAIGFNNGFSAAHTEYVGTSVLATTANTANEVQTLDFTGVTADNTATYTVNIGTDTFTYTAAGGDGATSAGVATAVAAVINADADFTASATGNVVTLTANNALAATNLPTAQVVGVNVDAGGVNEVALAALVDVDTTTNGSAAGGTIDGVQSTADSDNVIMLGTGTDTVALSTAAGSSETIIWTGYDNGEDHIVNFDPANDFLSFSSYLNDYITNNGSSSDASKTLADGDAGAGFRGVAADDTFEANSVTILTGFVFTATDTFAGLTAANLLAALNNSDADGYAGYDETDDNIQNDVANLIGNDRHSIALVESGTNDGEYKIFEVITTEQTAANSAIVTDVNYIGQVDFGDDLTPTDAMILG